MGEMRARVVRARATLQRPTIIIIVYGSIYQIYRSSPLPTRSDRRVLSSCGPARHRAELWLLQLLIVFVDPHNGMISCRAFPAVYRRLFVFFAGTNVPELSFRTGPGRCTAAVQINGAESARINETWSYHIICHAICLVLKLFSARHQLERKCSFHYTRIQGVRFGFTHYNFYLNS